MADFDLDNIVYRPGAALDDPQSRYPGFRPGSTRLKAGTVIKPGALPLAQDLIVDHDVAVGMRDGVTLYVDVYRPADVPGPLPAVVSWSPYGKIEGFITFEDFPFRAGVPQRLLSGLDKFEGPDPVWWCARGYAVINPDIRGAYRSEGKLAIWDKQEGEDGYDLVEWIAALDWCSGKVGLAGTSWLATGQWFIGAERPPHLAAIAPWEALSDSWRHTFFDGGLPDTGFIEWLMRHAPSETGIEDIPAMMEKYPEFNEYWARKRAAVERIDVPVYAAMAYGGKLHCMSFFDAWHRLTSADRWLRLSPDLEWPGFYENRYQQDLLRFFDYFLKGEENGWRSTPPVRMTVLDFADRDVFDRSETDFPVPYAHRTELQLAHDGAMRPGAAPAGHVAYDAIEGTVRFDYTFTEVNEINGYPELRLFVEARGSNDADVFVKIVKLSPEGETQRRVLIPKEEPEHEENWEAIEAFSAGPGRALYCYEGPWGQRRASRRAVPNDPRVEPVYPPEELLGEGEVVELIMTLPPMAMICRPGETLRLTVAGHNLRQFELPGLRRPVLRNAGEHVIHFGDDHPGRLVLPLVHVLPRTR